MIRSLILYVTIVLACSFLGNAQSRGPKGTAKEPSPLRPSTNSPMVVELFTSEGCSSCPPADAAAVQWEHSSGVIVLGEHVDYWDHDGWKDRFSSPLFSARQQDYASALRLSQVYTPEVVVNGEKEFVGGDALPSFGVGSQPHDPVHVGVGMQMSDPDTLSLVVASLSGASHKADVILAMTESGLETEVTSGENHGRRLQHAAVVRNMTKITELEPGKTGEYRADIRLSFRKEWDRSKMALVLLVQDKENRHILGAGNLRLGSDNRSGRAGRK